MTRFKIWRLFAFAFLALAAAGCDRSVESPTGPGGSPDALLRLGGGGGGESGSYTLANDPLLPGLDPDNLSVSRLIGLGGGSLSLFGHRLEVPAGAVLQPTVFTVAVLPTGSVEVYLTAINTGLLGRVLNVGADGFRRPVPVTLSYARSTNVPDPSRLVVLRMNGRNGLPEPLPSRVDRVARTVTADLDHFSRYAVAFPD